MSHPDVKSRGGWWLSRCYPRHSNQQPFCFIVNAGQLFVLFLFFSFLFVFSSVKKCSALDCHVSSTAFQKDNVKTVGSRAARKRLSVSESCPEKEERGEKKCFLKIKNRGSSGEAGTHFFFEGREFFHLSVFLRRWRDTGLTSQHFEIKRHFIVLCLRRWQSDCVFEVWKMCLQTNKQTLLLSGSWKNPYSSLTSSLLF